MQPAALHRGLPTLLDEADVSGLINPGGASNNKKNNMVGPHRGRKGMPVHPAPIPAHLAGIMQDADVVRSSRLHSPAVLHVFRV